jgi:adenosylcobinamide-phosphate synthase
MILAYQIMVALLLDGLLGDPRWLPHPVRLMGWLALRSERLSRAVIAGEKMAGVISVILVLAATGLTGWGLIYLAGLWHPSAAIVVSILLMYTCFAGRDMIVHSRRVYKALAADDPAEARKRVGMIVGRDTAGLDRSGVARACVESVAESMVDGLTAPLFWAVIGGPLGALLYKAVNTLDSTFGYKNERYRHFGWAAARLDDLLNFLPARLTGLLVVMGSFLLGLNGRESWRIFCRDRLRHASPNSGHTEAAVAGALGLQFGGSNYYFGELVVKPTIGELGQTAALEHILKINQLFMVTGGLTAVVLLGLRFSIKLWNGGF